VKLDPRELLVAPVRKDPREYRVLLGLGVLSALLELSVLLVLIL